MRLGGKDVQIWPGTLASFLFDERESVRRRFRHRFEVDPKYIEQLEDKGLVFSGRHPEHPIMQVMELPRAEHPYRSTARQDQPTNAHSHAQAPCQSKHKHRATQHTYR